MIVLAFLKKHWKVIAIVVLAFLLVHQFQRKSAIKESRESVQAFLNDTVQYYQNELGQEVAEKAAIRGDKESLQALLSEQIDSNGQLKRLLKDFRNTDAAGNVTTVTIIDSVPVPYEVPVPFEFSRTWRKVNPFYSISGISTQDGNTISNLEIPNSLSFAIGEKKTGFFKSEYRIEAVNSNPYVRTTGLDSYTLQVPKKRLGLSLYVGYGLSDNFTFKPSAGLALTYDLLRF